jgi:DnaK suppressor protein
MQTNEKQQLKAHMLSRIDALKTDIRSFEALSQPVAPDNAIGRLTRMEAINSQSINEAALNKARQTLARIEHAVAMIDGPDFGYCRECEEPIPFKRLMAVPETDLCVGCAARINR